MKLSVDFRVYPWQAEAVATLAGAAARDRLGHAWLLHGAAGLGKHRLAETLGAALVCGLSARHWAESLPATLESAEAPEVLLPDLHRLMPLPDKQTIGVDQVRALIEQFGYTSHGGGARVAIVSLAEQLTVSAANSLLKTLEEPPAGAYLLLVSHVPGRLPATLRSRCQRIALRAPGREEALAWLAGVEPGRDWARLLALSSGCPLRAVRYAGMDMDRRDAEWSVALAEALTRGRDLSAQVDGWLKEDPAVFLSWLEGQLEATLLALAGGDVEDTGRDAGALPAALVGHPASALFRLRDGVRRLRRLVSSGANLALGLEAHLAACRRTAGQGRM
ncbi:MAG: hypothetical protein JJT93_03465 [Gammaproteobacteria bacterium]|nr:hypothetical protein [Gammaproteobacteria bacterium]TVQ46033.1 MAG: hypothetical protein EA371_10960 [Gammaproteobacteria bacterium]